MGALAAIAEHGLIGDGRSVALVARDGTIDWLCWPRFDSDASMAALLHDDTSAGAWVLAPAGAHWQSRQEYVAGSNVLVTRFHRSGARLSVTDLMPVCSEEERARLLQPEHELLRVVRCEKGEARLCVRVRLAPRFGAGRRRVVQRDAHTVCVETRGGTYFLRGECGWTLEDDGASAVVSLRAGARLCLSLSWSPEAPAVLPPLGDLSEETIARTVRFWRAWARRSTYQGPHHEAVERSALVLKLMQYAPSGALIAAPTTSLPERAGGALNWDYRFCWLRDAAFTTRAFYGLGHRDEADDFVSWLLHATRLTQPRLAVLYDVFGNAPPSERTVHALRGHQGAAPVRAGNAADGQLQLDLHGEVIDAVCAYVDAGNRLDRELQRVLVRFGSYVASHWHLPDASIWEDRGAPRHYTHAKVLCWAALDGLLRLHRRGALPKLEAAAMHTAREELSRTIRRHARRPDGAYAATFGGRDTDAALLLLPWYGFDAPGALQTRATLRAILGELSAGDGLLHRNPELRAQGDGAFVACSFWAAELVADGAGTLARAEAWFDALCRRANPLGLLAEELDPRTGAALGNFPQAYSHVALINTALSLEERRALERGRTREPLDGSTPPTDPVPSSPARLTFVEEARP